MRQVIDRREMLGLATVGIAAGAAAFIMPSGIAYASEEEKIVTSDPRYALLNTMDYVKTGDAQIDQGNKEAFSLWREATAEASANGEEIITVVNPSVSNTKAGAPQLAVAAAGTKVALTDERGFWTGALISIDYKLALTYDVATNNQVSGFRNHSALLTYGLYNPSLDIIGYSYTRIDGGRTYAVNTTLYVKANLLAIVSGATFQKYSEYYYTGGTYIN
jgi:hypothetical protein